VTLYNHDTDLEGVPVPKGVESIVLFDGVCNLCNGAVRFIAKRDKRASIRFAPLQSGVGQDLITRHGLESHGLRSLVYIEGEGCWVESGAALRIARRLTWPWPLAMAFLAVPPFIRNAVYRVVAARRYRWFGKRDACMVPSPDLTSRFLQD
jgi:predicted DCC family thiol-disulfide oxidoreductase YuxK